MLEYHAALIADEFRTRSFLAALDQVVKPGMRVLDIGTGTGILAVHAARLGAEVVAVEESDMIDYARALARANGVTIDFRHTNSQNVPDDLLEPVDVIVSEMIGNVLLDEQIIPVFASARRFLRPGGVLIPRRARFHVAPCYSSRVEQAASFWRTAPFGFDWTPIAECMDHHALLDQEPYAELIGPGVSLPWIDLSTANEDRFVADAVLFPARAARMNAVIVWWECELGDGITLSQAPTDAWPRQHWRRTLLPVRARSVDAGESLAFRLAYDGDQEPDLWSWNLAGESRSSFFAFPPDRARRQRTLR